MSRWQYEIKNLVGNILDMEKTLNRYGQQGWELVSIVTFPNKKIDQVQTAQSDCFAVFKKEILTS